MTDSIKTWLENLGLGKYVGAFVDNEIDFETLPRIDTEDLKELGLPIGPRKKVLAAIEALEESASGAGTGSPSNTATSMRSGAAERRQLTVMFCDLVGSTELSERLDPEDLREVIRAYQVTCATAIAQFDGHISKYLGDGLLVYFGYPQAHEDDAARAIRAGLAILDGMEELNLRLEAERGFVLQTRMGIHTGLVVIGEMGGGKTLEEGAVVGETPNVAARLEGLAKPDSIVIGPLTRQLTQGQFDVDFMGSRNVKGISHGIAVYTVQSESRDESHFATTHREGYSALVGRKQELEQLLCCWENASAGKGRAVTLLGEAGVGKSRIVQELIEQVTHENRPHIHYQCSPYHTDSALYPVISQLERSAGFDGADTPDQKLDKIEAMVAGSDGSVDVAAPLFAALLSVPTGDRYPPPGLTPQRQKQLTLEALADHLVNGAGGAVLLLIEDAHWIDPTTQELLHLIASRMASAPLMLLLTSRPGFSAPWQGLDYATSMTLQRLDRNFGGELILSLTGGRSLPPEVMEQILSKTDGIPLFVEELTKTVLESGFLAETDGHFKLTGSLANLSIPETLQDALMARIDRLGGAKEVAQVGASIGREFQYEMIAAMCALHDQELRDALEKLIDSEIIQVDGAPPESNYIFNHAMVRDAAYESQLKRRRETLHERIARFLLERSPQLADSEPELIAHHFTAARCIEQAVDYWLKAGRRSVRHAANKEAVNHLHRGLDLLETLPDSTERLQTELTFLITLGPPLLATEGWSGSKPRATYERARQLCRRVGDPTQTFIALWGNWLYHSAIGNVPAAREMVSELLSSADQNASEELQLQAHHAAWGTISWLGEFETAFDHVERGLAIYDPVKHRDHASRFGGHDPGVCGKGQGGLTLWYRGYPDRAKQSTAEGFALAERLSHPPSVAHALLWQCFVHQYRGETDVVALRAEQLIELSKAQALVLNIVQGTMFRGWAKVMQGDVENGIGDIRGALDKLQQIGIEMALGYAKTLLGQAYIIAGRFDDAGQELDQALDLVNRTDARLWESEIRRLQGELSHAAPTGTFHDSEIALQKSLEVARRQGSKSFELRAATSLAKLWQESGRGPDAHDLLAPIYNWFTEGFETADLVNAKALIDELS